MLKTWAIAAAIASLVAVARPAAAAGNDAVASTPWPDGPFTMMNTGQKLEKVLTNFTQAFGLRLQLDEPLPDDPPATGRAAAANPTEFLNQMGAAHGLLWYHHDGALHISRTGSRITRVLPSKGLSGATLKRILAEAGLFESKFGWTEIEERGSVMVSGPAAYVAGIANAIDALPEPRPDQQIQVYRLKYAAVEDRVIAYRDKQITTPGVATVLRNLVAGTDGRAGSAQMLELAAPLRAEAEEAPRREPKAGAEGGGRSAGSRAGGAVIQADPRLNAIIVKDKPQNAPIYRALIDLLDVPGNLVEIEAMIVDVATTSLSDLGIDWSAKAGRVSADNSNGGVTLSAALGGAATATSVSNYILARISALESKGSAKVVSRPSIITQDNMGALIDLAQTFYIQSTGERVAQVTPVTVGVTLRVTPRVVTTGGTPSVQLVVDIEDGGIEDIRIGSLPVVTRSTVSTQAMVAETQSLVIGGLNSESNTRNRDGVPGLSSVPVAGALFSRTTASTEKRERLFVITPRVITPVGTAGPPKRPETQASNENAKDPQ